MCGLPPNGKRKMVNCEFLCVHIAHNAHGAHHTEFEFEYSLHIPNNVIVTALFNPFFLRIYFCFFVVVFLALLLLILNEALKIVNFSYFVMNYGKISNKFVLVIFYSLYKSDERRKKIVVVKQCNYWVLVIQMKMRKLFSFYGFICCQNGISSEIFMQYSLLNGYSICNIPNFPNQYADRFLRNWHCLYHDTSIYSNSNSKLKNFNFLFSRRFWFIK